MSSSSSPFREWLIIRHAKTDWSDPEIPDRERSLSEKGKRQACKMGHWLAEQGLIPDLILAAPDRRAQQTLARLTRHWPHLPPVEILDTLYQPVPLSQLLAQLEEAVQSHDGARVIALVGHAPQLEKLLEYLTGEAHTLSTCAIGHVLLPEVPLTALNRPEGRMLAMLHPHHVRGGHGQSVAAVA